MFLKRSAFVGTAICRAGKSEDRLVSGGSKIFEQSRFPFLWKARQLTVNRTLIDTVVLSMQFYYVDEALLIAKTGNAALERIFDDQLRRD